MMIKKFDEGGQTFPAPQSDTSNYVWSLDPNYTTSNGIRWSDLTYGAPQGYEGYNGFVPSSPGADLGFIPQLAMQLGWQYTPPNTDSWGATNDVAIQNQSNNAINDAMNWLQNQGYTPKVGGGGSTYYNGIFDKNGNLVASQGLDSAKTARDTLAGLVTTVGLPALGGATLSGAFGDLGLGLGSPSLAATNTATDQAMIDLANAGTSLGTGAAAVGPAVGNGAFLGEGTSAGIPPWDAAMSNAVPAIPPSTPSVFNAAQDSQLANQQLGITGDQAAAAATIPNTVDLTNAGGTMPTGAGTYPITTPPVGITPAQLQQGIDAAKKLIGNNPPTTNPATNPNNSGLNSLLNSLGQSGYAETAVNMGAINPFNIHGMDLATTPTTPTAGIQGMPGQGQSPDLNTMAGLLRLLGITQ